MGCRLTKHETDVIEMQSGEMFHENDKVDYKSRYERKMCLAKETPEPEFDLSDCNIKEVPSGVFVLCRVLRKEILNLSKNKLIAFEGGSYQDLSLLQILDLSFNKIKKLPDEIFRLENLREFIISNNVLVKLPRTINSLKYLEMLDVSCNNIRTIDEINLMPRLRILNLSGNRHLRILPSTLATCDNLRDLIIDGKNIDWPTPEIIAGGTATILKFISTGEINLPSIESAEVSIGKDALKLELFDEKNSNESKGQSPKGNGNSDDFENENALLEEIHLRQQRQKQEILKAVLRKQNETETLVTKLQQQKDNERNKLIQDILTAEENAALIFEKLTAMKISPDPTLLEKERQNEERLLEKVRAEHFELRKQEILATMLEMLQDEESRIQYYQQKRDESSRTVLEQENETLEQLGKFFTDYETNRGKIIEKICENEELQKQAVAALIAKNDARTWGLVEQLKIIEAQLTKMTQLEIGKKKFSTNEQMNELANKRIRLTNILMELLKQKEERKKELLDTLLSMEAQKRNEQDFWLLQYQRLLDSRPLEFSIKTSSIDPLLGYNFLVNGVIHCLPFLQKLWQSDNFCLEEVNNEDLKATGIREKRDRILILRSIDEFLKDSNIDYAVEASAPPLSSPESETEDRVNFLSSRRNPSIAEGVSECIICMEEPVKIIFLPCGHNCCCLNCQQKVNICPLCRAIIDRKIKVFQP